MDRSALLDRGAQEFGAGALQAAAATFGRIVADAPEDAEALSNLGGVLNAALCHEAAEAVCRAALVAQPGYWAALANLATALHRRHRQDEAVPAYVAALNANPGHVASWTNLGVALADQWRLDGALAAHEAALKLAPNDPEVRNNRALALLSAGDYAQGFAEFEWRWRCPGMKPHGMGVPQWLGEPAGDRTVLLHDEGGFGDTLQFVRYAPLLAGRGMNIVLRVQAPLVRLLRRSFPQLVIAADDEPLPAHDLHCPMLSLPNVFGTCLDTVPGQTPYLAPREASVLRWRERLAAARDGAALSVGLVWAGSPRLGMPQGRAMNLRRSIGLARLAPLAGVAGVQFVSLQHEAAEAAPDQTPRLALFDPMAEMADFDDTAALVAALDLVITVDSAVAHLAGALGRPVCVLSRYDACWRWLAGRQDSPWYPKLRLYRQPRPGDWNSVVGEVVRDLAAFTATTMRHPLPRNCPHEGCAGSAC